MAQAVADARTGDDPRSGSAQSVRARRLSSSVWLPWLVGLAVLLLLSVSSMLLVGRDRGQEGVSEPVILGQERVATAGAQFFRRSANEAVADVAVAAAQLVAAPAALQGTLDQMLASQERWSSVAIVSASDGAVLASAGDGPAATILGDSPSLLEGISVVDVGARALLVSHAPLVRAGQPDAVVVGVSDRLIVDSALAVGQPGVAWVMDDRGRVLAANGVDPADSGALGDDVAGAAGRGSDGSTGSFVPEVSGGTAQVVSWAPVSGRGPAGSLGWSVVVMRTVGDLVEPDTRYRVPGELFGLSLAVVALIVFGWIRWRVLRPISRLENVAERVAYGDLSRAVPVIRYDEVGQIARALERVRLQLIRRRSTDVETGTGGPARTGGAAADRGAAAPVVLVADDDPAVRVLLVAGLSRSGYRVLEAEDGEEGVAQARRELPDLAILDWMMPRMPGVDACRALKSDARTQGIHVVMLTTLGDEAQVAEAFDAGADDYLTKPFDVREVVALVGRAVGIPR